jgi:hypothetical protein
MRRRGIIVVIIAVAAALFFGVYSLAYRAGESSGRSKVSADRSAFQTRVASAPQPAAGGGTGSSGTAGGAGTRGSAGGSAVAGGGGGQGRGSTNATMPAGSAVAGRATSTVAGKVTAVSGTTLSVQQADNTMVSVTTNADTAVRKLVTGALTDLKAGDIVAVDGSKTSDTALSAKTVTSLGAASGTGVPSGGGGRAGGGGPSGAQTGGAAPALTGQIKSVAGGTIMVQGFDGSSVTVTTTPATVVRTQQPGAVSDIKAGDMLLVQGDKVGSTEFLARTITNQGPTSG